MDLTRLRIFVAVVDHGSFAAAADALAYTPSAVSQQMARLEAEVGARLVERSGRGTTPTAAGDLLLGHARDILERVARARRELDVLQGVGEQRLGLGAFSTAATTFAAAAVRDVRTAHAGVRVTLREVEPFEAVAELRAGRLDAAVVYERERQDLGEDFEGRRVADPAGLSVERLLVEPYVLALPGDHPLTRAAVLDAAALDGQAMIGNAWWPGVGALVERLGEAGATVQFDDLISQSYATVLGLVAAGEGLALVPAIAALQSDAAVRYRVLADGLAPARVIQLVTVPGRDSAPLTDLRDQLHRRARLVSARVAEWRRAVQVLPAA